MAAMNAARRTRRPSRARAGCATRRGADRAEGHLRDRGTGEGVGGRSDLHEQAAASLQPGGNAQGFRGHSGAAERARKATRVPPPASRPSSSSPRRVRSPSACRCRSGCFPHGDDHERRARRQPTTRHRERLAQAGGLLPGERVGQRFHARQAVHGGVEGRLARPGGRATVKLRGEFGNAGRSPCGGGSRCCDIRAPARKGTRPGLAIAAWCAGAATIACRVHGRSGDEARGDAHRLHSSRGRQEHAIPAFERRGARRIGLAGARAGEPPRVHPRRRIGRHPGRPRLEARQGHPIRAKGKGRAPPPRRTHGRDPRRLVPSAHAGDFTMDQVMSFVVGHNFVLLLARRRQQDT